MVDRLCVFAELGVFARNLTSTAKKAEGVVSRKTAKLRKDAKQFNSDSVANIGGISRENLSLMAVVGVASDFITIEPY